MKKMLHSIKALIIATVLILAGVNLNAQNICAATNTISPASTQNICIGSSSANALTATITSSGSGNNGNITYTWYSNTTNSTTGGTMVQTLSTTSDNTTNIFTPPSSSAGTLWYYCTVTNNGGDCTGTSFTTSAVQVNVNALPKIFNVTGGGARCSNGAGVSIKLSGSEVGVNYQFVENGVPTSTIYSGTGNSFGIATTFSGTFTIIATNATTGCTSNMTGSAIITTNAAPSATYTSTEVSCQGNDGSITVTGSGGTPGYLFNVDGGVFSNSNVFSGLAIGNHSVGVQDANSCSVIVSNINVQKAPPLSVSITSVNPGDCSGTNGSITVSMIGGVNDGITPIQYKLDGDATRPYQTSNVFGGLSKGNYTITIQDSKGCTAVSSSATLTQTAGTAPTVFNVTGGGSLCSGGPGVGITLSGSQVGVNYQFVKNGVLSPTIYQGTGNPISIVTTISGTFTMIAINSTAGCTNNMAGSATIIVNQPPKIFNLTGGGARCSSGSGVPMRLSGSEVGVNYQFVKNGVLTPTIYPGTGNSIGVVTTISGAFIMIATNASTGCTSNMAGSATITTNTAPKIFTVTGGGVRCNDASSIPVMLSGSETGVNYQLVNAGSPVGTSISGTGSSLSLPAIDPGTYSVVAVNSTSSCTSNMSGSVTVTVNPALTPSYTKYYASSCVGGDGTITVTGNGGTPGYLYSIDNGSFTSNNYFTGLAAGEHTVQVKDANSCIFTYDSLTILTAPIMKVTAGIIPTGSCTGNDGSITGFYFGGDVDGITPLQYELNGDATRPFQTSNTFNGLSAGNYTVTIKDSKGCLATSSVITLTQAAPITFVPSGSYQTNVSSCGNGSDGNIVITVTGGVLPFSNTINGVAYPSNIRTFSFGNLAPGTYNVIVTDLHGCSIPLTYNITQASAPVATVNYMGNETCIGKNNGYITISPTGNGGVPGYMFSKDGGATYQGSYSFTNLAPGVYSMVVKDSKGCISSPLSVTIKAGTVSCRESNTTEGRDETTNDNSKSLFNSSLRIQAYPNPSVSSSNFTLDVQGNSTDKVLITVTDILGRRLYQAEGSANQQYKLGSNLKTGIYVVQVVQGDKVQTVKIVKE